MTTLPLSSRSFRLSLATTLLGLASTAWTADAIRFKVVNTTPDVIREIYVCPTRAAKWGPNLLQQRTLEPGKEVVVTFEGGCGSYDLRLVAPGGTEYLDDEVTFCEPDDVLTIGGGALTKKSARQVEEEKR